MKECTPVEQPYIDVILFHTVISTTIFSQDKLEFSSVSMLDCTSELLIPSCVPHYP